MKLRGAGRLAPVVLVGLAASAVVSFGSLFVGPTWLSLGDWGLIADLRLPRIVAALAVGGALGAAGCMFQAVLRNPLASPSVIGTSAAAGFGAVVAIFLRLPYLGGLALSFAAAVGSALLVLVLARTRRGLATDSVVLTGLAVALLFAALTGLVEYLSEDAAQLSRMVVWLLGGLWQVRWGPVAVLAPVTVVALAASFLFVRDLDLLSLGENDALRLGLRVGRQRTVILVIACLLTSLAVSLAGVVAFVGLVVPHAARRVLGPSHAVLLPASVFLGGIFVVAADSIARTASAPNELPLGVVTSIVGVPFFLVIMRARAGRGAIA